MTSTSPTAPGRELSSCHPHDDSCATQELHSACAGGGEVSWIPQCQGCGFCCLNLPCLTGRIEAVKVGLLVSITDIIDVCPFLFWRENRYWCRLASTHSERLMIGEGCCWPGRDDEMRKQLLRWEQEERNVPK